MVNMMKCFLLYLVLLALGPVTCANTKCGNIMCTLLSLKKSNCLKNAISYCTHIFYQPTQHDISEDIKYVKKNNIKVIMSIPSSQYSNTASSLVFTGTFLEDAVKTARKYEFDGIFIMWIWPKQEEKDKYHNFLRNAQNYLDTESEKTGRPRLLLFHLLGPGYILNNYNLDEISRLVDYSVLFNTGWSGPWNEVTGHNSPIEYMKSDISYILNSSHPSHKLINYQPIHGRSFELAEGADPVVGAPVVGEGVSPLQGTSSEVNHVSGEAYYELCHLEQLPGAQIDKNYEIGPYLSLGSYWLAYEDIHTITIKTQTALKFKLGGVLLSALEDDDCYSLCPKKVPMPMLRYVDQACKQGA